MILIPRSIVAAVDFGDASARAVTTAGEIADRCRAALTLLHAEAVEAPAYFTTEQVDALERQRHTLHTQAEQFLSRFGRRHTAAPFSVRVDDRPAVDAIVHASGAADLVVMGTHGRHGPKRWWLGSVAERVLHEIAKPLLVVRGDAPAVITRLFDRSLLHAPGGRDQREVADFAHALANCFGGHVLDGSEDPVDTAVQRTHATLVILPAPHPRTADWLARYGEPLVRFSATPILFVPVVTEGVTS
jgi:nucleotide-binding universal stress UspA family protein